MIPMLATSGPPPSGTGWAREFKWDGMRVLATVSGDGVRLCSRTGQDLTSTYSEVAGIRADHRVVLDGEVVALNAVGRPDFELLQRRMHVVAPTKLLLRQIPVQFYVFDVLEVDGVSVTSFTYGDRRRILTSLNLDESGVMRVPPFYTELNPDTLLDIAREHGLEGIVSKELDSRYEPGRRSPSWVKTALTTTVEVVVGGWTMSGNGERSGSIGSLLVGVHHNGVLRYAGHVGSGFTEESLAQAQAQLAGLEQLQCPLAGVPTRYVRAARWVRPVLVGEVECVKVTRQGRLRGSAWRGWRPDRTPEELTSPVMP